MRPFYTTTSPLIPQAASPGQLVGLVLQNTSGVATGLTEVSFGQVFKAGAVSPGAQLYAMVTGADGSASEVAVQLDAKTFNADGSVATSVLSFLAPAIAANASSNVMLSVGPALANAAPLDLAAALKNYSLTVDLAVQTGTAAAPATTNVHIDAVAAMQAALANGTASFWQSGPNASQARVIVPVTGSMQMVFDITANANGTFATDVQFDNDEAWVQNSSGKLVTGTAATDQGGTVTYNETITQNGSVVSQQSNVTQYQYQNWHKVVTTQPSLAQINIQHDVAYLEATGAVQNYDLTTGIPAGDIAGYVQTMASAPNSATTSALGSGYGQPLAANGVDPGMNGTGSRPDIGPTTNVNSDWLMTQNATVAQYALGEADAAGAVPWNMQNGTTGLPLTTLTDVNLWTDPRGGPYSGSSGLVQNPNNGNNWEVDTSHQPDLSYDPYILTGSRYNFDELQQQAAYSVTSQWPAWQQRSRNAVSDLIVNGNQVRGAAWELRQVDEAAATALPGSAMQSYFTGVENDNFAWLVSQEAGWTAQQGQAYGWLPGVYGNNGNYGPWEQDFLSIVVAQAAEQGNALAKQFMAWEDNFIVGRFLQAANGFLPADGIAYTLQFYDPKSGLDYQTWAQIEQVTASYGLSNGPNPNATGWAHSQGYYGQLALASLAGVITVFGSDTAQGHQAIQAYGWLLASGAPFINMPTSGQYSIVPRLADGNLLTRNDLLIGTDAAGATNTLSLATQTQDQLITAGAGNDTLKGGTGINILFGGSGNDQLIGGPGNDLLYGGAGATTLYAAAGTNYLQAGTGPDTFILNPNDAATDTIQGFRIGIDQLAIVGGDPGVIQTLVSTATADAAGNAVLHLSPTHDVTLTGVSLTSLMNDSPYNAEFIPLVLTVAEQTNAAGVTTLQNSGERIAGGAAALTIIDNQGANTINGGAGGLTLVAGAGDLISTSQSAKNNVTISDQNSLTANGADAITVKGIGNIIHLAGGNSSISLLAGANANLVTANGANQSLSLAGNSNAVSVAGGGSGVTISGSQNTVSSASSQIDVSGNHNSVSITPGQAGASGATQGNSDQVVVFAGAGNTLQDSNTNIVIVSGDNSVTAAGSALIVGGSSAAGLASLAGTSALFAAGGSISAQGENLILLSGGLNNASINATTTVFDNGGANTVSAAQGGVVYGGGGSLVFAGGAGVSIIYPGQGSVTAFGGSGGLVAHGGSAGGNLLEGGTGSATLFGGGNADTLIAGAGPANALFAGWGNETLNAVGATGSVTLTGGQAPNNTQLMLGGGGTNIFEAGGDAATMIGGASALSNIFVFGPASGNSTDIISGFRPAADKIELMSGVYLAAPMAQVAGITKISLSDGTQISVSALLSNTQASASGVTTLS